MALRTEELAKTIDQTLLGADAASGEIEVLCRQALDLHLASVCVLPRDVPVAAEELRGGDVKVCAVLGFPAGAASVQAKIAEAERALAEGAGELEFVMNVRALRGGDIRLVRDELVTFVRTMRMRSANGGRGVVVLKAIIGTADLEDKLKQLACKIIERAEVDFAQTAAGHGPAVATVHDVELLRDCLSESVGVKASGGIETLEDVYAMANAGAGRIGSALATEILNPSGTLAPVS
jgi:deoxyribose-phosphate aldolase